MRTCLAVVLVLPALASAQKIVLSETENAVLEKTNAERKAAGIPPLAIDAKLLQAARSHSANMAKQEKLEHTLDEKTVADRVRATGYGYSRVGENIAHNQETPAEVLKDWMESEGHKKNILNADFTHIGVAVATNAKGERYWTQVFAAPLK